MIDRIVSFALSQPFMVLVAMLGLGTWGVISFQNLPIDAYPDLSPPRVQIVSQWPGHAAEEVERQITIPLETADLASSSELKFVVKNPNGDSAEVTVRIV